MKNRANGIIEILKKGNFYAECPCGDTIPLREANLFYLNYFNTEAEKIYRQKQLDLKEKEKLLSN